jgi:hypothetical protein
MSDDVSVAAVAVSASPIDAMMNHDECVWRERVRMM